MPARPAQRAERPATSTVVVYPVQLNMERSSRASADRSPRSTESDCSKTSSNRFGTPLLTLEIGGGDSSPE